MFFIAIFVLQKHLSINTILQFLNFHFFFRFLRKTLVYNIIILFRNKRLFDKLEEDNEIIIKITFLINNLLFNYKQLLLIMIH